MAVESNQPLDPSRAMSQLHRRRDAVMIVDVGKHSGKSVGKLILAEPAYVLRAFGQEDPDLAPIVQEAQRLIGIFDAKPLRAQCRGYNCDRAATRCTVYHRTCNPMYWCDHCDPHQLGARSGKLHDVRTYQDALAVGDAATWDRKWATRELIQQIAKAKGFTGQFDDDTQLQQFFCDAA